MCKVISVANIKGGVAKTTTAANLGVGLVKKGKRVLLVDLDPQGSLSLGLGIRNNKELPYTVSTVIQKVINEIEISEGEGIIHNDEGVDILPSNHSLRTVEQQLDEVMSKEHILEEYIDGIRDRYDYIIIDTPPVAAGADASIIGRVADGIILVIRNDFTKKNAVKRSLKELEANGGRVIGCVLNRVKKDSSEYGHYGYYDYYY